ncbi:hypothetical protein PFISCL1PPCAC_8916, partial [Pristionchus fissidentatus]
MEMMATVPLYYDPNAYPAYAWPPMMAPFPATPTSAPGVMYPDTTVKSGSEMGDTPPSGGSGGSGGQAPKRKFKSPQEAERYRLKRDRNNLAAQKSRFERRKKEEEMQKKISALNEKCAAYEQRIRLLEQENLNLRAGYGLPPFNNENLPPQPQSPFETKAFAGYGS